MLGTKLAAESDDGRLKKPASIFQQSAVDEKGRRRFHGAFTGGFSAGYFNTVGSKEGWAPAEFISSRENRTASAASASGRAGNQRLEDFMDEQDFQDSVGGGRILATKSGFGQRNVAATSTSPSPDPFSTFGIAQASVVPAKESVGEKLLRLMGYKRGDVIGSTFVRQTKRKAVLKLQTPGQ